MQSFVVPGHPVPHVRMTQRSKHEDPQASRYLAYKDEIGYRANLAGITPIEGAVGIVVEVFVVDRKFDASNALKAYEDGLNGIGFADDFQVIEAYIRIHMGACEERAEITIYAIEGESLCQTSSAPSPASSPKPSIAYPKGSISTASRSSGSKTAG